MITFFIITGILLMIVIFFYSTVLLLNNTVKFMRKHQEPEKNIDMKQSKKEELSAAFFCGMAIASSDDAGKNSAFGESPHGDNSALSTEWEANEQTDDYLDGAC